MTALRKPKQRSGQKKKIASYMERARRGLKGLTLTWTDQNPFENNAEIIAGKVTHKNPTQRIIVQNLWAVSSDWIMNAEFTYLVTLRVVFETEKRGLKVDELEFTFTCALQGKKSQILNDAMESELRECLKCNDAIPDGHKNKGKYSHCEFEAVIVGV